MNFPKVLNIASHIFGIIFPDKATKLFIRHNRKLWGGANNELVNSAEVLFEYNNAQSAIISYSYLANVLSKKYGANIIPFRVDKQDTFLRKLYGYILSKTEKAYRSFGARPLAAITISSAHKKMGLELFKEIYPTLKTKRDVELIEVHGISFGDLIYDQYLREHSVPTIDIKDTVFARHLIGFLSLISCWEDYLNAHDVKAVNVSHCVYDIAILPRLAISRGIPAYQANATHVYRMNSDNLNAYTDFTSFPDVFASLPKDVREKDIAESALRLERRFAGEVGVDMTYSSKSAFTDKKHARLLGKSNRKKILIATHCFFDSPHPYGINLFPDFYEWLTFLGKISEQTDYDWYIKTHPDFLPGNTEIIESILKKFPIFKLLPSNSSHHQIIDEGIDVVLTVYGTIGFEYAALGIPVINASLVNPHCAYNFNLHPSSVEEYRDALMNIDGINLNINKDEIYEYYFMKHIYNTNDWLFDNYEQMIEDLGSYSEQFTSRVYEYWIQRWTPERHAEILAALTSFIDSEEFRLGSRHLGRDSGLTVGRGF